MKLSRPQIKKIIIEEYLKDTYITEAMSREKADEVIAWIKGDAPRPSWLTDDYGKSDMPKSGQSPYDGKVDRAADTMPFGVDSTVEPADVSVEEQVTALVQSMPAEEMLDLFTNVIEKLAPEYIEPQRRQIGFKEVKYMIQEVLEEVGDYHFGFGDEEKYDALDPHGFNDMDDEELIDQAERDGIEVHRYLDDDGYIISPEFRVKLIDAIKNV